MSVTVSLQCPYCPQRIIRTPTVPSIGAFRGSSEPGWGLTLVPEISGPPVKELATGVRPPKETQVLGNSVAEVFLRWKQGRQFPHPRAGRRVYMLNWTKETHRYLKPKP